ncbi:hypothetical protein D9O36_12395 [Zobellia amurskyensis]|uniref:Uncharacterized protein n=1 Tax=Zobellia amurskyensis TaxID=248905 RepID=A0A7X2ZUK8_9FLAO|nr:hypothetical protein [Zobellia amurskyensis]MUH36644.1 hypothetical protein [Zobellia amurskyensis]
MKKRFSKYFLSLCILLVGVCGQLAANSAYSIGTDTNVVGHQTKGNNSTVEPEQYILSGLNSSSSEKQRNSKIEVTDEQEEEEESEPTLSEKQLKEYSSSNLLSTFYQTGYFFHLIKNQFSFYRHFIYLSTFKTLHLMFSVLQL